MHTRVFVDLLIVVLLLTFTHGKRTVDDDNDASNSEGDGGQTIKVRETVDDEDDDSVLRSADQPVARRHLFDLNSLLQRRQSSSSSFTQSQRQFQNYMLQAHNEYRARHCASALQLDDVINRSAQDYANYLAKIDRMVHSNTNGLGENLFWKWSSNPFKTISGTEATDSWYDEIKLYSFNSPGFSSGTGHFTQVVWKGSKKLGIGYALTSDGRSLYVVAQYSPPGNYMGQFSQNVAAAKC